MVSREWIVPEGYLTQGARSLLNFLRFRGGRNGQCWWKQSRMAEELGCHRSSIVRWVAELVDAGYLNSIRRGSTANLYNLRKTCEKQHRLRFPNATTDVANCDNVDPPVLITEIETETKNLSESGGALMERTPSEIETLKTQITTFRYRSGAEVEPSPDLLTRLIRKADFYRVSLYVLAAHFERARRTVERVPSSAPESSAWFLAVAENALKSSNVGEKRVVELPPPKHKSATDLERAVKLDELSRKPPDYARWNLSDKMLSKHGFDGSIAELARRKKLG